ncbi:MAG: MBL fold metallo-hydrolase [Lachnotalea sp.]
MKKVTVLDIKFKFGEVEDVIHPVVLKDDVNMVLIDGGYTGFLPILEQAMEENNLFCGDLTHVLITHQDHDHMGILSELKQKYPHIQVVASKKESPYISGQLKSLRLEQAEAMQLNLPEDKKPFGLYFCNILKNVQPVEVDLEVEDGEVLNWCGGCTIIETPGHTPGHISIYVNQIKVMITGDAAALENGELVIVNPQFTLDNKATETSLNKIMTYGAKEIICYHGGIQLLASNKD